MAQASSARRKVLEAFVEDWAGGHRIKSKVSKLVKSYENLPNAYKSKQSGGKEKGKLAEMSKKVRSNAPVHSECGFWEQLESYVSQLPGSNPQHVSQSGQEGIGLTAQGVSRGGHTAAAARKPRALKAISQAEASEGPGGNKAEVRVALPPVVALPPGCCASSSTKPGSEQGLRGWYTPRGSGGLWPQPRTLVICSGEQQPVEQQPVRQGSRGGARCR